MSASLRVQAKTKPGHETAALSVPAPTATTSALFTLFILKSLINFLYTLSVLFYKITSLYFGAHFSEHNILGIVYAFELALL